jgi:hypothetical protein
MTKANFLKRLERIHQMKLSEKAHEDAVAQLKFEAEFSMKIRQMAEKRKWSRSDANPL